MTPDKTHAAVWRCFVSCAALAATALVAHAQPTSAVSEPAAPVPPDQVVQMDQFEVTTTQGHGYVATNSTEAFKTNESLMDIPQIDTVVTNDLIKDIGFENLGDVLQYFGVISSYESDSVKIPGGGQLYADEFPIHAGWTDSRTIDSVELIKGGAEGLYMLNSGLGGIVMKTMKKPIPSAGGYASETTLWATSDQFGLWQAGIDTTGPIGRLGDVEIGYRLVADYQNGKSWLSNVVDDRKELYPYFEARYKNTIVRFHYDAGKTVGAQYGGVVITPTGQVYTGAGRDESNQPPNNANELFTDAWEATILQKFSDSWEMRLSGQYFYQGYYGAQVLDADTLWGEAPNPYLLYSNRENDQRWKYWTVISDISGKYDLGPSNWEMHQTDIFGWAFTDQVVEKYIFSTTVVPFSDAARGIAALPGQAAGTFAVPANNAAAIANIYVPPLSSYYEPATGAGSHTTTWNGGLYWQHTAELVPNWFDVTVGESWISIITDNVTNISVLPWQATEIHTDQWVHRIAGSFYPFGNKQLMLYALEATNFSPGTTITYLESGASAPPQVGMDRELGAKTLLMGGRLSADFRWEKQTTSNIQIPAGIFANGTQYVSIGGFGVEEGVDGDLAMTIMPGWQLIGSFYAGHDRDQNNNPLNGSWDNNWGAFTRYDFPRSTVLRGVSIGGGYSRIGSRWISTVGILNGAAFETPYTIQTGEIKVQPTNMANLFINYAFNKHVLLSIYCVNALNDVFPVDVQTATMTDLSPPRMFRFEVDYKF